jgi:hypothetical protein
MTALGHTDSKILRDAYGSLLQPMRVPDMGPMSQPQQVVKWMRAAFVDRMELADRIGMNTAMLTCLMQMQGLPVGKGDMAHVFSDMRATYEGYLLSDDEKTREGVLAFIDDELLKPLGPKRWTGSWANVPQRTTSLNAYAAATSPGSSEAEAAKSVDAAAPAVAGQSQGQGRVCYSWQTNKGCKEDQCPNGFVHPNGKRQCSRADQICHHWMFLECLRDKCQYKHPNGKSKRDAPTREGKYNRRDLTPVGQRHTPVETAKYIYDKGEPVKVDPKAAAAHERNKNPRVKVRDPQSD